MANEQTSVISLFYCYAYNDSLLRDELDKHLVSLRRSGRIKSQTNAAAFHKLGLILERQGKDKEAQQAYDEARKYGYK